jgi:hypothetical protein
MKIYNKKKPVMDALKELQTIPGIGASLSQDLVDLGYRKVNELKGEKPEAIYQNLMALRGKHIDRCVLYVFRCAVYYVSNSVHDPESLKWWNWKDGRQPVKRSIRI